jgi:hypothetical protein
MNRSAFLKLIVAAPFAVHALCGGALPVSPILKDRARYSVWFAAQSKILQASFLRSLREAPPVYATLFHIND